MMLLLLSCLVSALVSAQNYTNQTDCEVSLTLMADGSSDGWNGNTLTIHQDDTATTYTLTEGATGTICDIDVFESSCVYVEVGGGPTSQLSWEIAAHDNSTDDFFASGGMGTVWLAGDATSCFPDSGDGTAVTVTTVSFDADTVVDQGFIDGIEAAYLEQLPAGTEVAVVVTKTTTGTMTLSMDGTVTEANLVDSLTATLCPATGVCTVMVELVARRRLAEGSTTFTFTIESDPNAAAPADALTSDDFVSQLSVAVAAVSGVTVSDATVENVDEVITAVVTVVGDVTVDEAALETAIETETGVDVTGVSTEVTYETTEEPATAPEGADQGVEIDDLNDSSAEFCASSFATIAVLVAFAMAS